MAAVWDLPSVSRGIDAQRAALQGLLDGGERIVGWKLGLGAPAAMEQAGIGAPLVGFLTSATLAAPGTTVSVAGWRKPVLEPEVAVHLGRDVPAGADRDTVGAAVSGLGPAIELADVDAELHDLETVVGGNVFHRRVILGAPTGPRGGQDTSDLRVEVRNLGRPVASTDDVTALTGDLLDLVGHVARWLGATGQRLTAGQLVITGSVVPIIPIRPGDEVEYRCQPLGSVSVRIAA